MLLYFALAAILEASCAREAVKCTMGLDRLGIDSNLVALVLALVAVLEASCLRSNQVSGGEDISEDMLRHTRCPCNQPSKQCLKRAAREAVRMNGKGWGSEKWERAASISLPLYLTFGSNQHLQVPLLPCLTHAQSTALPAPTSPIPSLLCRRHAGRPHTWPS